ncbi:T9SS type B sorting domain-containing protein [Flavobacterium sp. PL02]|uniref:T9SS type B sorting domain-containing protein n=1 Tax=Flavobacterium sp. PL02 TaxID=3088354 RepID=UPI002B225F8E|nr:T9SS type B sorting domain-containing protein [Flavobacterium sp. PL02]MEA9413626.1 T9SS type B sorting domain-containing protein [Flavobacterium sp. PL02]
MKKPTIVKITLFALIFLQSIISYSQNYKSFDIRYNNKNLRGDILLIGNSVLNRDSRSWWGGDGPEVPFNDRDQNSSFEMKYVNVDGGAGIFNSSKAKLTLPDAACSKIVYVGLYWSAVTRGTEAIDKVKFKMPGGSYVDIDGTVIYNANGTKIGTSLPYACYANVTDYFTKTPRPNPQGYYSVANISTAQGTNRPANASSGGTGLSAGWSLFFVYENATLPEKAITSFDGFSAIDEKNNLKIEISGFTTIPVGQVKAKFAFSAIEGDLDIGGDYLSINGFKSTPQERPQESFYNGKKWVTKDNFFNSSVTSMGTILKDRDLNSSNTLGFDAGVFEVKNDPTTQFPGGSVIKNGDTSAIISLGSDQDLYFYYFNAFAVEIIAPRIVLLKKVFAKDDNGKYYDAGGKDISIDKELKYEISFQNKGNDNAVNFTITDILPNNIIFNDKTDFLDIPDGVKVKSYDAATRTIVFDVAPELVVSNSGTTTLTFRVKTVKDCDALTDACSNVIDNTANSKYNGVINDNTFGEGSLSAEEGCNVGKPTATNFLIGLEKCKFEQTLYLCGTVKLKAGGGYTTYVWKDPNGNIFGGNNQEVTVTKPGTYTVVTSAAAPCKGITQTFIVKEYTVNINDNPVNSFADNIDPTTKLPYTCINDGKPFPKIFLCGKNATKPIDTKIEGASSIVWQETKDPRPSTLDDSCPDVTATNWTEVAKGPTYTANRAGTFRLVVTYNNTCENIYYFNVTQSVVDPTFTKQDIVCDTKGSITITNPKPNDGFGYQYSLDGVKPYQDSNVFDDVPAGRYIVHIKTKAVDNTFEKCEYTADVTIIEKTFKTKIDTTDPSCAGKGGTIKATVTGVDGWYQFIVTEVATGDVKGDSGKIVAPKNFNLFEGIAPGIYDVAITTKDGCVKTERVTINDNKLDAKASITTPLTCNDGVITVVATGGTPVAGFPDFYYYYVNGDKTPLTDPLIPITKAGTYDIVVIDAAGCSVTIPTITVPDLVRPTVKIDQKNINCYGSADGEISFTLTPATSDYTVSYSINGLAGPFSTISPIKNLAAGDYDVVVKYTYDKVDCFDESVKITITAPATKVTASAGVAELSGCGPTGSEKQGKVRITNAQGGIPPYKYSFDGINWQDSNEAYINPRATPYTFYIKDSSPAPGCPYAMTGIILEEKPADPTIEVSTPTFNCDGNASTTVTITNTGGANYEYEYLLNGVVNTNTPPNVFVNVPPSVPGTPHKIEVRYKLISAPTFSNLLNEDFGSGPDETSPGINPAFCWERQVEATKCNGNKFFGNGEYTVTNSLRNNPYDGWHNPVDHTTGTAATGGRYLAVDAGTAIPNNAVLYRKTIKDIVPDQPIQVRFFATNLLKVGNFQPDASLTVELQNSAGKPLSSQSTGGIPKTDGWVEYNRTINPGSNTTLDFVLRLEVSQVDGIDFAVDDIEVYQLPKSCLSTKKFEVIVDPNKKFTADVKDIVATQCKGNKDGRLTIIASNFDTTNGFEYLIDGVLPWKISKLEETIVDGLGEGEHTVKVRYDATSVGCDFTLKPTVGSPDKFEVEAKATAAKCSIGATVTASGKGGTKDYTFTLTDSATPPNVVTFPSTGILTDVKPGTYTVSGKDKNGCLDDIDIPLVIDKPVAPKAEIANNTGLCFDGKIATITVNITDGVAPYFYQVKYNTGLLGSKIPIPAPATSFTYEAKATGDYTFVITDSYGCEATVISQTINANLTADAQTATSLTCIDPKEAKIEVTINGGTTPFSYIVKDNLGNEVYASPLPIAGPKFTYTTTIAGKYTFEITDKNKCITTAEGNVASITNPTVKAEQTNISCHGLSDGSVVLTGYDGTGDYQFSDNPTTGFTSVSTFNNLTLGKHKFYVKDTNGCVGEVEVDITQPDVITPSVSISTPYTCETKAIITASATGGNGTTYTYVLKITKGGVTTVVATNNTGIFKDLTTGGAYSVTITDSKGCTVTEDAGIILDLVPITAMNITNSALKCPSNLVDVTITSVTGGKAAYEYSITAPAGSTRTWQPENIFKDLAPGTYTFTVRDANKCTFSFPHTIKKLIPIVIEEEVINNISCLGSIDGSAKFTIKDLGNNVRYSYDIDGGTAVTGTTPTTGSTTIVVNVPNLGAGDHTLTITDLETNCQVSKTAKILAPAEKLEITKLTVTPMTCDVNGKVVVDTKGGWGTNKYTLTQPDGTVVGPQSTNSFDNLTQVGDYKVTVKDLNGCEVSETFELKDKVKPKATIDVTSDLCYDKTNKATIIVTPDVVPSPTYEYKLDNGTYQPTGTFSNLEPGDYIVTVRDKVTGCTLVLPSQHIAKELRATVNLDKSADCTTTDPDIIIKGEVFDGTAPYTYTVTVNGVADPIVKTITGNKFSYTNNVATTATTDTKYVFVIKDNTGCEVTSTVTVKPKTDPQFTAVANSTILCNGESTGSITVTIDTAFGVGPYVIDVLNTTTNTKYFEQTTGLPAGNYTVKVTDSKSCFLTKTAIIKEPLKIKFDAEIENMQCNGAGLSYGSISVKNLTGGSKVADVGPPAVSDGPFTYTLTNNVGQPTQVAPHAISDVRGDHKFTILSFGIYELTVTDANNCSVTKTIKMASPPEDMDITVTGAPVSCTTAELLVTVKPGVVGGPYHFALYPIISGSIPPYEYASNTGSYQDAINTTDNTSPQYLQSLFTGLNPGVVYSFIVYDEATNCYYFKQAEKPTETASTLKPTISSKNVTCMGNNDGKVTFKLTDFNTVTTDIKYEIYNSQTNKPLVPAIFETISKATASTDYEIPASLKPGTYYILFTELNNLGVDVCINASKTFTITESVTPLTLDARSTNNANCNPLKGIVEAFGKGGTTLPAVVAVPATPTTPAIPASAAVPYLYQIVVDNGAIGQDPLIDVPPTADSFVIPTHTSSIFKVEAGNYLVYVRDAYGCIAYKAVTVVKDPEPIIDAVIDPAFCSATEGNFAIKVNITTLGVGPYTYTLNGGNAVAITTTPLFTIADLTSGKYKIKVKDLNGCTSNEVELEIFKPLDLKAKFTLDPVCDIANGTITAEVSGGDTATGPGKGFEFTLKNKTVIPTPLDVVQLNNGVFLNQAAGSYTIIVKDLSTSCTKSVDVDIPLATKVVLAIGDIVVTLPNCMTPAGQPAQGNVSNGTIKVNLPAANNNPDYTYILTPLAPLTGLPKTQLSNGYFTGLVSGDYNVTVKSERGCEETVKVTIGIPVEVVASAAAEEFKCSTGNTPKTTKVTVTGAGGTGKFTYSKDNITYGNDNEFYVGADKAIQNVTYYVKDENDCIDSVTIPIAPFPSLIAADVTFGADMDCENKKQVMDVVINGGTNTPKEFTYQVYKDGVLVPGSLTTVTGTTFPYEADTAGSYYEFEIFDNNTGCSIKSEIQPVPLFNDLKVTAFASTQVGCKTDSTGKITIDVTGYTGAYTYEVYNGISAVPVDAGNGDTTLGSTITAGLPAGNNYTVVVKETGFPKCSETSTAVIITEPLLALSLGPITNVPQNCKTKGAQVTVPIASVIGGTPDYKYAFVKSGDSPIGKYFDSNTATLDPTVSTKWDVWVIDKNLCSVMTTVDITVDPLPSAIVATPDSQCYVAGADYTITVTANGVGPLKYSLTNVDETFTTNNQLTVKGPGTYDVYVKDANGCITKATAAFTILKPLELSAEISTYPTCNGGDGVVTLQGLGGTIPANYQYATGTATTPNTFSVTAVFPNLTPGTKYYFWVKDMVTNCMASIDYTIPTAAVVTIVDADLTATPVTCFDGANGTITVTLDASNNNPDYKFTLTGVDYKGNAVARAEQKEPTFSNLPAGKYTVSVMSGRNCPGSAKAEITQPAVISIDKVTVTEFLCNPDTNAPKSATIEVIASGGTQPLSKYVFIKRGATPADDRIVQSGKETKYTSSDLAGSSYIIEVYDSNTCPMTTTATIKPYVGIKDAVIDVDAKITCNDGENIKVTVTSTGGILPLLEYSITYPDGTIKTNLIGVNTFTNLPVGQYTITVKNPDTGCSIDRIHNVNNPNTFELKATNIKDLTCFDSDNGSIDFTLVDSKVIPSNLPKGFKYVITGPTPSNGTSANLGPLTIGNLKAGSYKITATLIDSPFCDVDAEFEIKRPLAALELDVQHSEITCAAGSNDGKIIASAKGGWPGGYEFQLELNGAPLVAWSTQSTFSNLGVGNYIVKVRDTKMCEVPKPLELKTPAPIVVTANVAKAMLTCFGDNSGEITVTTTGGSGKYLYTLVATYPDGVVTKNGPQPNNVFTGLKAASYVVIVTDSWTCTGTSVAVEINEPPIVKGSLAIKTNETCLIVPELTLTATGGTGPYKYSTNGTDYSAPFNSSVTIVLPFTTTETKYKYFVQDVFGCTTETVNSITPPKVPELVFTTVTGYDIHCKGSSTGSIYVTAVGGLGNYVYTLLDPATGKEINPVPVQSKPGQFENLAQGTYIVKVDSGDCNNKTLPVTIIEPTTSITANAVPTHLTCNASKNGMITVIASGGTRKLRYAISPNFKEFFESNVFDNLKAGFYHVLVQDENGCELPIKDIEIKEPGILSPSLVPNSILPELCFGEKNGSFSIEIVGGTAPYRVSLDDRKGTYAPVTGTNHLFTGLVGGIHTVYVLDANNCTAELEIPMPESVKLEPTAKVNTDCVNNVAANFVTITIHESANPADVDYALDGSTTYQDSNIFVNVAPGTHTVTARHTNGCEQTTLPFTIEDVQPLTLTLTDGGLNEIVATATGGGGEYQYTLDGEPYGSVNKFIIYKTGTYTVVVTDKNGCTATATRYVPYIDVCIPNHFTPNGDGINDTWAPGCTVNYKDLTFDIFDRYGRIICKYRLGQKWDGKYNGAELPSGDYWYVLKLNDNKDDREFVGHFTLYR